MYRPAGRNNFCHFPDYNGPTKGSDWKCGNKTWQIENEKTPWCYSQEAVEEFKNGKQVTKYGICNIDYCQCGTRLGSIYFVI